ncbi:type III-B CRISPR module-associated protein Cmr5 [Psychrobacter sp. Ps2]|uniref:type III-B CRISPR module-associated protein Cmr5 n=1 Tax=Psychrobacter sp. Ps2 TaxID=2790956 RepID=UPI001EDD8592|nr:type III-B CRISPR module-associated protein Cmr5 [Psychrobacter sp. Ps2]MCG3858840.1 type III-B CRISPR module-associated protein Cmr5 [Psychrobacter sp. Ps2]
MIQSRDQFRAKHALEQIELFQSQEKPIILTDKDIKSAVSGLPAMIHMNGLGHAFAFYLSDVKNFPARAALVNAVFDWLKNHSGIFQSLEGLNTLTPLTAITRSDLQTYQIAQQEAQAYLLWLKKFARALLTDNDDKRD